MSYALETKKRKFERILESLTDSLASPSRAAGESPGIVSNISVPQSSTTSSKRRRVTPTQNNSNSQPVAVSLSTQYLPSSRAAYLARLETFRNVTKWHIPSTSLVNAAEWAKRGWICEDVDTVACPSCRGKVFVDLEVGDIDNTNEEDEERSQDGQKEDNSEIANDVYEGLVKRYNEMIVTSHENGCAWRKRGCDTSIQRIEGLLNATNVRTTLKSRYDSVVSQNQEIPHVATLPSVDLHLVNEEELKRVELEIGQQCDSNTLKLAICGWQSRDSDVVECRHCFRSLGLWLYRGDIPTVEHLDPIESHLEYCPWRSAEAQDTEGFTSPPPTQSGNSSQTERKKLPGWQLVYQAIIKSTQKTHSHSHTRQPIESTSTNSSNTDNNKHTESSEQLTPEQRDKKMKDLRQRIRDLKKPFNFKELLRKKDKNVTV